VKTPDGAGLVGKFIAKMRKGEIAKFAVVEQAGNHWQGGACGQKNGRKVRKRKEKRTFYVIENVEYFFSFLRK
jgi:hypothetical protein